MTALALLVVLTAVPVAQDRRPAARGGQAKAGNSEPLTVGRGLEAIEGLRSDGLKTLNDYASAGANKTTKQDLAALKAGPLRSRGSLYERTYDQYAKALERLRDPGEGHPRRADQPRRPRALRRRVDPRGVGPGEEAELDRRTARRLRAVLERGGLGGRPDLLGAVHEGQDADRRRRVHARLAAESPQESVRQREAADLRKRLRAEPERRLSAYWDEAREAGLAPAAAK